MTQQVADTSLLHDLFEYNPLDGKLYWKTDRANGKIKAGSCACMKAAKGYLCVFIQGKKKKAHHVVWAMHKGYWPKKLDHIDGIRAHNFIGNLRETNDLLNAANRGLNKNNSLGMRGVHKISSGKYRSCITYQGVKYNLGVHNTPELAKAAYDAASLKLRKEYHREC